VATASSSFMIKKIRTPDEVFRREKTDIYFIDFREQKDSQRGLSQLEIENWLSKHLPEVKIELLGPFENSMFIEGGPLMFRLIISDIDLKKFCEQWEDKHGKSVTNRFQLCQLSYQDWLISRKKSPPNMGKD
jgi:hypothetical protein